MAKFVSKFLDFVGLEESGPQEEEYDAYDPYDRAVDEQRGRGRGRGASRFEEYYDERRDERRDDRRRYEDRFEERERYEDRSRRKGGKVVNHPSAMDPTQHQMKIYQMEGYDDARTVIDDLLEDRSVLINLELVDVDVSQRIVDMLSGATYALGASLKKAAANTYLLAPMSVDVSGSYEEEDRRRGGGSFFGGRR